MERGYDNIRLNNLVPGHFISLLRYASGDMLLPQDLARYAGDGLIYRVHIGHACSRFRISLITFMFANDTFIGQASVDSGFDSPVDTRTDCHSPSSFSSTLNHGSKRERYLGDPDLASHSNKNDVASATIFSSH